MADDVLFEKRPDGVGLITLNRPDRLNAMGGQLMPMLTDYLDQCLRDREIRAVVLTGAGRAFCAGGDVKEMGPQKSSDESTASRSMVGGLDEGVAALREAQMGTSYVLHTMPKPTIAMVNGAAAGAGLSLALACDLRIVSDKAKFVTAFGNVGLSGDFGGSFYMTRLVGPGKARELYFTSEMVYAEEALKLGMVNRVVPHDKLTEETLALAAKLAAGPTTTFAHMKENFSLAEQGDLKALMDQEAFKQRLTSMTNDSREAVRAFNEKRDPMFTGS